MRKFESEFASIDFVEKTIMIGINPLRDGNHIYSDCVCSVNDKEIIFTGFYRRVTFLWEDDIRFMDDYENVEVVKSYSWFLKRPKLQIKPGYYLQKIKEPKEHLIIERTGWTVVIK